MPFMNALLCGLVFAWESGAYRQGPPPVGAPVAPVTQAVGAPVSFASSPNATGAKAYLDKTLPPGWDRLPVVPAGGHSPLSPLGILPYPTLFRIDEAHDMGGIAGSTYLVWGLGAPIIFKGAFLSRNWGHNRLKVYSGQNPQPLWQLVKSKHVLNPFQARYAYRILKPSLEKQWADDDVLFTINKDIFGRGFLGIKSEWRIYQGRERNNKLAYYCVSGWKGWKTRCWHSKGEYESGRSSLTISGTAGPKYGPCAVLSQVVNAGAFVEGMPDQYYLFANAGEDTALLMSFAILFDTTEDAQDQAD